MQTHSDIPKWILVVAALAVGLLAGYYYGESTGLKKGVEQGAAQEKRDAEAKRKIAEQEAAKAVNPFEQTRTNPFENAPVNPYESIKINPFR